MDSDALRGFHGAGQVGMAMEEVSAGREGRQFVGVPEMAVGGEYAHFRRENLRKVAEDRKLQQHLVHFAIAISSHRHDVIAVSIQHLHNFGGVITSRDAIAGSVI